MFVDKAVFTSEKNSKRRLGTLLEISDKFGS